MNTSTQGATAPSPANSSRPAETPATAPSKGLARAASTLAVGQMASQGLSFLRSLLLARFLVQADYGMAAAFALSVSLLEIAGRMAFGQQTVQSRHGTEPEFQATAHTFQLLTACFGGLLILLASPVLARSFGVPQLTWAFATLALIPVCMGLEHLDIHRHQRELRFLPSVSVELIPQLVTTLALVPLLRYFSDFRAFLALLILKAVMSLLLTHALAKRPYRLAWNHEHVRAMLKFGTPLLLNGLFMFASQQADQFVIGSYLSLEDLALYSVPVSMLMVPWIVFARVLGPIMLPTLSRLQNDPRAFNERYAQCLELSTAATIILSCPFIVSGGPIASILYGSKYGGVGHLATVMAIASAFRFLRFAPTVASMALGDTKNQMFSNLTRASGLLFMIAAVALGMPMIAIAASALIGEVLALLVAFARIQKLNPINFTRISRCALVFGFALLICASLSVILKGVSRTTSIGISILLCGGLGLLAHWLFPSMRGLVCSLLPRLSRARAVYRSQTTSP